MWSLICYICKSWLFRSSLELLLVFLSFFGIRVVIVRTRSDKFLHFQNTFSFWSKIICFILFRWILFLFLIFRLLWEWWIREIIIIIIIIIIVVVFIIIFYNLFSILFDFIIHLSILEYFKLRIYLLLKNSLIFIFKTLLCRSLLESIILLSWKGMRRRHIFR